jgi:hypothetical protein
MTRLRMSVALVVLVLLSGCSVPDESPDAESNERLISQVDYGEDWPFTVEEGVLSCQPGPVYNNEPLPKVVFTTGGTSYGINGQASGSGNYAEVEAIWRQVPLDEPSEPLATVQEAERRQLFADGVACEDSAIEEAERRFLTDLDQQYDESDRLLDSCMQSLLADAGLTEDEFTQIRMEGLLLSWPPLTPPLVSISPVLRDGLALCEEP